MSRPFCALCALLFYFATLLDGHAAQASRPAVHVVRSGDTLSKIALKYGATQSQVRQWNGLRSDRILAGQRLELWPANGQDGWYVVRRGDSLSRIAQRFDTTVAELRRLNGLKSSTIHPGQKLKLEPEQIEGGPHVIQPGDTLSEIALKYGTTIRRLKRLNRLGSDRIRVGDSLKVTDPIDEEEAPLEYVVRPGDTLSEIAQRFEVGLRLLRRLNGLQSDTIRPGKKLKLRPTSLEEGVHVVQQGETLSGIALKYGIPLKALRDLNGIEGSVILIGQKLRLRITPHATHIVERGDALWEIARAYGMEVEELQTLNGLSSDRIYPGQELKLGGQTADRYIVYTVERGDYLGQIARLHQMSMAELKQLNGLRGSVIHPGDKLKVRPLLGRAWLKPSEIDWDALRIALDGVAKIEMDNGPYYFKKPKSTRQKGKQYFEGHPTSPLQTYRQARKLWTSFESRVGKLGRLSNTLDGWHLVLDPGHGGLDPGAIASALDGNGKTLYVVEDEYVYDVAIRVYVLLRLHGARVSMTLLSPNHLIRQSNPPAQTFVNEKNEVYNSYEHNKSNRRGDWPSGGNLLTRVRIARNAFAKTPKGKRIFLSFHADIDPHAPEVPLVLYYESRKGKRRDLASRSFARTLLPALGAGARTRGQALGVLRDNPADVKLLLELRNMAYRDHVWALRFEQYRHRDAEKIVRGILDYARSRTMSAHR
jgi:LysM repeat protein/N-acetylmuramoyl-L-alanine amidase